MQIALRPAVTQDFEYCERLYFSGMSKIIEELNLNVTAQAVTPIEARIERIARQTRCRTASALKPRIRPVSADE